MRAKWRDRIGSIGRMTIKKVESKSKIKINTVEEDKEEESERNE